MKNIPPRIVIVDYNPDASGRALDALRKWGLDAAVTKNEGVIGTHTHILLPPFTDLSQVCKKLTNCNLFQFFRLVNRPVLAMGTAAQLLCMPGEPTEKLISLIPLRVPKFAPQTSDSVRKIRKTQETTLLKGLPDSFTVLTSEVLPLPIDGQCTTAVFDESPGSSAVLEHIRYFAVLFDIFESDGIGKIIFANFLGTE